MVVTKTVLTALSLAVAVATSECENHTWYLVDSQRPVVDWSGNVWFASTKDVSDIWISRCPQHGECTSKQVKLDDWVWPISYESIAVDDSGPLPLVYLGTEGPSHPGILQCVWDVNSEDQDMSCSVFAHHPSAGMSVFAGQDGNVFIWDLCNCFPVCTACGMSKCSSSGECEPFGGDFAERFHAKSAVIDSHGNVYLSQSGLSQLPQFLYAKCTSAGNCTKMEFTGLNGSPLHGEIAISPDDVVYMADSELLHIDEVRLLRCSPDNVCNYVSTVKSTGQGYPALGFTVGQNGDFYSFRVHNGTIQSGTAEWELDRQCFQESQTAGFGGAEPFADLVQV